MHYITRTDRLILGEGQPVNVVHAEGQPVKAVHAAGQLVKAVYAAGQLVKAVYAAGQLVKSVQGDMFVVRMIRIPPIPWSMRMPNFVMLQFMVTASVVQWSEFLATDTEVPGSIPGATRFSEQYWIWNGVHSAS